MISEYKIAQHELSWDEIRKKLGVKLGVNEAKVYRLMLNMPTITIVELSDQIGISTTAVENNIKKLKEKAIIDRTGSDKTGKWEVLEKI